VLESEELPGQQQHLKESAALKGTQEETKLRILCNDQRKTSPIKRGESGFAVINSHLKRKAWLININKSIDL